MQFAKCRSKNLSYLTRKSLNKWYLIGLKLESYCLEGIDIRRCEKKIFTKPVDIFVSNLCLCGYYFVFIEKN